MIRTPIRIFACGCLLAVAATLPGRPPGGGPSPQPPASLPPKPPAIPLPSGHALPQPRAALPPGFVEEKHVELIELRDVPLDDAVRLLSEETGLRIVASPQAGKTKVSLYLKDVPARTALESLTRAYGCYLTDHGGVLTIYTAAEYQADLISFREEFTENFTLLFPNAFDVGTAIRDLYGNRVQLTFGDDDGVILTDLQSRFNRFDLIDQRSQSGGLLGGGGGFGGGGLGGGLNGLGGLGGGFGGIGGLGGGGLGGGGLGGGGGFGGGGGLGGGGGGGFAAGNQQTSQGGGAGTNQQSQNSQNATIYVTVIRRHNQLIVRTSDSKVLANLQQLIHSLDVPTPLVLLEVKVLSIDLGHDFTSVFDYRFAGGSISGGFSAGNVLPPASGTLEPQGTGLRPTDLIFQVVSEGFRFRMQLAENQNRVTEVATPMVLTANNEVSRIFIGQTVPITVGFSPGQVVATGVGTANTIQATPITTLTDIGTQLLITPNINADRTVTLRVSQQTSNVLKNGANIPLPNPNGGVTQVPVDVVRQRTFSGTVVAKDGLTIAIGGLIEEGLRDTRREVPVISKIPYLGFFFRDQQTNRFRREQVILIRPYVFFTPTESACISRDLLRQLSIHPMAPEAEGTLNTYVPRDALRPDPPLNQWESIFKVHFISPKDF